MQGLPAPNSIATTLRASSLSTIAVSLTCRNHVFRTAERACLDLQRARLLVDGTRDACAALLGVTKLEPSAGLAGTVPSILWQENK